MLNVNVAKLQNKKKQNKKAQADRKIQLNLLRGKHTYQDKRYKIQRCFEYRLRDHFW